jgi:predicted GH43/DUF377 family glycosyl hydrolase
MSRVRLLPPISLAVASALALSACSPAGSPSSLPPTAGATTAATEAPTAGAGATVRFVFGPDPVVTPESVGLTSLYINPGAVIEVDGTLHMFPNLFSTWPGRVEVPHLTSTDGVMWTTDTTASTLSSDAFPMASPGIDVSTGFVTDDGTWVLIYETVSSSTPWLIGRASAPSPQGPWTIDPEPIVVPGASGSWDAGGVQWPSVVRTVEGWSMYFAGFDMPQGGTGAIGLATSTDGVTWVKRESPVLEASELWEGRSLDRPRVVQAPDGLAMVYAGRDLTDRGLATSTDGVSWARIPGPAIERTDFPVSGRSWDVALLYRNGELEYFLEIGSETTKVYRAVLPWDR